MAIPIRAHVIVLLAERVHRSPLHAVGEVHPRAEVVGVETGGAVQFLAAELVGLHARVGTLTHQAAKGVVVVHLLQRARLAHHHADVAQVVPQVVVVLRRARGGERHVSLVGEQARVVAIVYHVTPYSTPSFSPVAL